VKVTKPLSELKQRSPEWFAERRKRLTASNFGSAAGIKGAYKSRAELWKIQTGRKIVEVNEWMQFGTEYEPVAKFAYEVISGNVVNDCGLIVHPDHDFLGCSPDGIITSVGLLETKCRTRDPHESISHQFMAQIQGQLACTQMEQCHFQSWSPTRQRVWEVKRSDEYWDWIFPFLTLFWSHITSDVEPQRSPRKEFEGTIDAKIIYET
jgi:putative phage-type endonuclease